VRCAEIGELTEDVGPSDPRALVDRSAGLQREHHVLHVVRHSAPIEACETERGRRIEDIRQSGREQALHYTVCVGGWVVGRARQLGEGREGVHAQRMRNPFERCRRGASTRVQNYPNGSDEAEHEKS
jgi:hypothetical protein